MELAGYPQSESAAEARVMSAPDRAYLAAMAEAVTTQDHSASNHSAALASPPQKRKRGLPEPPSPSDPRRPKRSAPSHDVDSANYVETAVEAAQAVAAASVSAADFTALQQATADHHEPSSATNASSTAAAALGYPTLHIPPSTEETFAAQMAAEDAEHHHDHPYGAHNGLGDSSASVSQNGARGMDNHLKPAVGSEEWHKVRKDNHKEVERRRRETINEGINELGRIVPGCEKNKGSILQRAVAFINQLKENEASNLEKWTLEKLLTEQAIQELSTSNDKLKQECERAYRELAQWKQVAQAAGVQPYQKEEPSS